MDPISVNALNIVGRVTARDPSLGNVFAVNNADMSAPVALAYQFGVQSQGQTFGVVKSIKVDNGTNPSPIEVSVSGTDDFFTIPAFSIGVYTINANQGSTITLTTEGGATDVCTVTFYNYEVPPAVWYSFGAFNTDRPIKAQGTMAEGDDVATSEFNDPVYIGGKKPNGTFAGINTDADGNIIVSNLDITIGAVYGPDSVGAPPTHPGILMAVLDSAGNILNLQLTADGDIKVVDTKVLAAVDGLETLVTATNTKLDTLIENTDKATTGTASSVAAATADTSILASNANRQCATVFNDSTAILYLLLAAGAASNTVYTVQVAAGGYYEVPAKYTGAIRGIWAAANGAARITEMV